MINVEIMCQMEKREGQRMGGGGKRSEKRSKAGGQGWGKEQIIYFASEHSSFGSTKIFT